MFGAKYMADTALDCNIKNPPNINRMVLTDIVGSLMLHEVKKSKVCKKVWLICVTIIRYPNT